jgi:hypothetical protein
MSIELQVARAEGIYKTAEQGILTMIDNGYQDPYEAEII